MTTPQPAAKGGKGGVLALTLLVSSIIASLLPWEGDFKTPYRDQAGVLTVCKGITGPGVIEGKTYTQDECDALETAYVTKMVKKMGMCVHVPMSNTEWIAYGHWSYNVGTYSFCHSTLNRKLNAEDRVGACHEMGKWTYLTLPSGQKINCRDKKSKCGGLPKRRDFEVNMCLSATPESIP